MSANRRGLSNHKPSHPTHLFDSSMIRFYASMSGWATPVDSQAWRDRAIEALLRAMLKSREKVQKYALGKIANFKAWLTTLARNLCADIY